MSKQTATDKEIYDLFHRSENFQHITEDYVKENISNCVCLRKDDKLIGIATFKNYKDCKRSWVKEFKSDNTLCLCQFLVDFLEQSKGCGRVLFEQILKYANEKNYDKIILSVTPENKKAVKFYLKNDFKKIGSYDYDYVDLTLDIYTLDLSKNTKKEKVKETIVSNPRPTKKQRST